MKGLLQATHYATQSYFTMVLRNIAGFFQEQDKPGFYRGEGGREEMFTNTCARGGGNNFINIILLSGLKSLLDHLSGLPIDDRKLIFEIEFGNELGCDLPDC